jgi:beta-phosphoglucomutase-like phosphatase (HAD superfamily)
MALPRPVKAVVFDMDGLLVDTEQLMLSAMCEAARHHGRDMPFEVFQRMVGLTHAASDQILLEHFGADFAMEAYLDLVRDHVQAGLAAGVALKSGVTELLDYLDELAMPRAIATSSSRASVESHLGPSGIVPRFHALITKDVVSRGKPHPEPYLLAASALATAPEHCLALEDSHNGVRSAAAAGMMTIMVPDLLDPTEEMHSLCVRIARDLHEVHDLLKGLA